MEFRVLQYFLAVAREESVSGAAAFLHLSQPTLSRQLKDLEDELGKRLFIRGSRKITLTEEGMLLRKRAEEIVQLMRKAEDEIALSDETVAGNIYIGSGETDAVRFLVEAQSALQQEYPQICFHIQSGDKITILEWLDRGLVDVGLVFGHVDTAKYDALEVPFKDTYGVLMHRDSPLSEKTYIEPEDLWDKPLILSRQEYKESRLQGWLKREKEQLNIVATYNLLFNGSLMVKGGVGYALCLDKIIHTSDDSELCFRPLFPKVEHGMHIIWKKYLVHSKATQRFLQKLQEAKTAF